MRATAQKGNARTTRLITFFACTTWLDIAALTYSFPALRSDNALIFVVASRSVLFLVGHALPLDAFLTIGTLREAGRGTKSRMRDWVPIIAAVIGIPIFVVVSRSVLFLVVHALPVDALLTIGTFREAGRGTKGRMRDWVPIIAAVIGIPIFIVASRSVLFLVGRALPVDALLTIGTCREAGPGTKGRMRDWVPIITALIGIPNWFSCRCCFGFFFRTASRLFGGRTEGSQAVALRLGRRGKVNRS
jgi:hypothetical protein